MHQFDVPWDERQNHVVRNSNADYLDNEIRDSNNDLDGSLTCIDPSNEEEVNEETCNHRCIVFWRSQLGKCIEGWCECMDPETTTEPTSTTRTSLGGGERGFSDSEDEGWLRVGYLRRLMRTECVVNHLIADS